MADPRIWILADDRAGNVVQCVGVAEALGEPFIVKPVAYDVLGRLHNVLRGATSLGLAASCRAGLQPPWPHLVIAAGRRTAPLARWLKRTTGARLVQIMDPGWPGRDDFDLIAAPRHDRPLVRPNVIATLGSCHRVGPRLLAEAEAQWQGRLPNGPGPRVMLSVGGATKDCRFTPAHGRKLVADSLALATGLGAQLMITTSRRTGRVLEAQIAEGIPEPKFFHPWADGGENPYLAMLALADAVVVTGDSMNMCTEACATGKPVFIFAPPGVASVKHARLHEMLYGLGYARPLGGDPTPWRHAPLNPALDVAAEIRARGLI